MKEDYSSKLSNTDLVDILGYSKYSNEKYENNEYAGVVPGLAWTAYGGVILLVESTLSKGKGKVSITGNLGDVMKESVSVALNYIKAHADELNIPYTAFENWDLHVHFPEGATPKDGPSAGITLVTAITSVFTQRKIKKKLAMTGEITLRGKVLPIGGVKEKILAAKRAGIKEIILPKENEKDIKKIKENYVKGLKFHFVKNIMEVLNTALLKQKITKAKKIN
jgi:ATP-dependent Lon protease